MRRHLVFSVFAIAICLVAMPADAQTWRSTLYGQDWTPPQSQDAPPSFEDDKVLQDFSHAGYRRSEVDLPEVMGPVFDAVDDFGADPSGDTDTTAQIQEAIDEAADAGGGVVYLGAGTYRVSPPDGAAASLRIRDSNVVLRGAGPAETFILNDEWEMRGTDIIRVDAPGSGWSTVPDESPVVSIADDLLEPTVEIPLESSDGFSPGDWIILRADTGEAFAEEHNMGDLWADQSLGGGVMFKRQILSVDADADIVTIDVPTRYYLKMRDNSRVHRAGPHIEEVGLEDFSIGNIEHPDHGASSGWSIHDYNESGTHAYDVHGSYALRLGRLRHSWVRNVHTYRPEQNSLNAHVLSNGLRIGNSVAVTVKDSSFERALYAGGGGNAYMVRITNAQEILLQDTSVGYNRHGFVFSSMQTSGNVIHRGRASHTRWRAIAGGAGSSGSDHHMWLSQSNLVDNTQLLQDYFAAYYRHTWGSNHGHSATHSVFWNLEGLEYHPSHSYIVNTQQARYGYAIGTRGAATGISTAGTSSWSDQAWRAEPEDHVEGQGLGDTLEPRSLFDDQLFRRMTSPAPAGRVATPTVLPFGGTYDGPRYVHLETDTADADIYYTLDGTAPTTDSAAYDGPFELSEDANLRARAVADGYTDSQHVGAHFRFPDELCWSITDTWKSQPMSLQRGLFEFVFEATPAGDDIDAVMGLSHGDASQYQDLAAIARFNVDGHIDARDGGEYSADAALAYEADTTHHFRMDVDLEGRTYDVYVRPDGDDDEVAIATDFALRDEQVAVYQLNRFSTFAGIGENQVCNPITTTDPDADELAPDDGDGDGSDDTGSSPTADAGHTTDTGDQDQSAMATNSGCACSSTGGTPAGLLLFLVFALALRQTKASRRALPRRRGSGPQCSAPS